MHNIVVIEGPRGSGKTTLTKRLTEELVLAGFIAEAHKVERGKDPNFDMLQQLKTMQSSGRHHVHIFDRFHLTEYVMSSFYKRRPSGELFASTGQIERALQANRYRCIILTAPIEVLQERIETRNDGRGMELPADLSSLLWESARLFTGVPMLYADSPEATEAIVRGIVEGYQK